MSKITIKSEFKTHIISHKNESKEKSIKYSDEKNLIHIKPYRITPNIEFDTPDF